VLGGALANPVDGAVLLFRGDSPEVAETFAKSDPYVTSGLVKRWKIREWTTVVGEDAATPVRPGKAVGSGDPDPSEEDIELTRRLSDAGRLLGIELMHEAGLF
jgi:RadC-like JAB domain